jgi:hypothetical protein
MATLDRDTTEQARLFVLGVNLVPTHRQSLTARKKAGDPRFASLADICTTKCHVRFTPKSGY